jgi:hypothetical protein
MSSNYNINNINCFYPSGSVLAYIGGTVDPDGWVIADGATRSNSDGRYNTLINAQIGTSVGGYTPPNLKAAFLRGTGTNGVYSGPSLITSQTHALQNHVHTIAQTAQHTHTINPTLSADGGTSGTPTYGLASEVVNGTAGTSNITTQNGINQVNLSNTAQLTILTANPTTTIENSTGTDTETAPYCYGVLWIIKL